jgi:NAD(P)-dependent dehydrogenase (short-subunit alcohol dehydrogenase family)
MTGWTIQSIPPQRARLAVVTGTGGIGYEDAFALARAGAEVVIAGRNPAKGNAAVARIWEAVPHARVRFEMLDLADLASIAAFAERLEDDRGSLDLLINNAAVMALPKRRETIDGFELQFGTNHLGHFALTARLLPLLRNGRNPRVVTVSSIAARSGAIDFDDLQAERSYRPMRAYSQSKLANLMFAQEFQRRSVAGRWGVTSIAAHPGVSRTDLIENGAGRYSLFNGLRILLGPVLFQSAAQGALPTLFAATSREAVAGGYYGPDRLRETRGSPAPASVPPQAEDLDAARRLWEVSEQLTGVGFRAMELMRARSA